MQQVVELPDFEQAPSDFKHICFDILHPKMSLANAYKTITQQNR